MDLDRFKKSKSQADDGQAEAWASWLSDGPVSGPTGQPGDQAQSPANPVNQASAGQSPARPPRHGNGEIYRRPHASNPNPRPADSYTPPPPLSAAPAPYQPTTPPPHQAQTPAPAPVAPQQQSYQPQPQPTQPSAPVNVSINISMPHLKKPTLPKWPYKKIAIYGGIAVGLIIIALVAHGLIEAAITRHKQAEAAHAVSLSKSTVKPTFTPVAPVKDAAQTAKTAAFDGTRDTYSFTGYLNGTELLVSQQPIPASFDSAQAAVVKIAKSLNATTPLLTHGTTAYEATDKSSGAQTVVYALNNVLVFIQSPFQHDTSSWKSYLNSLK